MTSTRVFKHTGATIAFTLFVLAGCNSIVGLDKLEVTDNPSEPAGSHSGGNGDDAGGGGKGAQGGSANLAGSTTNSDAGTNDVAQAGEAGAMEPAGDCQTNQECSDRFSAEAMGEAGSPATGKVAGVCVRKPAPHCVKLLSEDCDGITGDYLNDHAIVVGSLFSTKGTTAPTNLPRQQSAALAIEQINAAGGVPGGTNAASARPLVLVSCDESTNLVRAATHLVTDLHVPAIVGPNTSQDTLDVSTKVTVPGGTVVMSPTGVASSIANLRDNDLTWLMVPSDVQRAPLMISQLNAMESSLNDAGSPKVKLGIIFRNDALGIGTRTALSDLTINRASLAAASNANYVSIDPYNGADADQHAIVDKYKTFQPQIIVLAGTAEAITKVMVPLEAAWPSGVDRPEYVLIDSTKVPELLTAVTNDMAANGDLRSRVRGTGITPGPMGKNTPDETNTTFLLDYKVRYGTAATTSGMGPSHDAAYAIGLALAATATQEVSGANVAKGLRMLAGGPTKLEATAPNVLLAFQKLTEGEKISAVGTYGMLDWDANGAVQGGTLEMWCIGLSSGKPSYAGSGLYFDIKTQKESGAYVQCAP